LNADDEDPQHWTYYRGKYPLSDTGQSVKENPPPPIDPTKYGTLTHKAGGGGGGKVGRVDIGS
jgi:hypothetical protein